ncbi:MAG TPA: 4-oxalomesaconate tautomerase [Acidimicrobiia bacterium]|nr:4-oxalomesaconate tautomerase [Acidimicrobiia bacterium]
MSTDSPGIPCMLMRGGTSKGAFFLAEDLPSDGGERDALLLRVMGSPDPRQIDGVGGAHPLTTKVAVVSPCDGDDADLEYLFLQVSVDRPEVSDKQNCGNMLAAVGPFAVERGLLSPGDGRASVRILMKNTGRVAVAVFPVESGSPVYAGDTEIAGVPGSAAEIVIEFEDIAGSSSGALLPTGRVVDTLAGVEVTLIDNGMPVVLLRAADLAITGYETCEELEADARLRHQLEEIRLHAGPLMNLGDVTTATVPKMTLVAPPRAGGAISTRTFIPHRCHQSIGVLGAVSVATACHLPGSVAARTARLDPGAGRVRIEHPTGSFDATVRLGHGLEPVVVGAGIIRTARKLMDGVVFPRSY